MDHFVNSMLKFNQIIIDLQCMNILGTKEPLKLVVYIKYEYC